MTNVTAFTSTTPSATPAPAVVAQAATPSSVTTAAAAPIPQSSLSSISPRITVDPVAGVITQYLDSTGKVTSQYPSTVVIAYLKAGLTAQGYSKHPIAQLGANSQTA